MNIPFSPPDISEKEIEEVVAALKSGWITTGPKTKEFEKKISAYCGSDKTVCLSAATTALEMTLRLLGIGEGDEVIVPAYTYTATCSVICHVGATPVMIDSQEYKEEMDYSKVSDAITEKTKVIMPVDIAGILCNYDKLYEIIESKKELFAASNGLQKAYGRIIVLADCAHGFGAVQNNKTAGTLADFTCFSFHAVKNLTTAEGGAVTWKEHEGIDSEKLYKQLQILSLHGQTKDALEKTKKGSWEYDILLPAYKCNMTDVQAGIGLGQLERYDSLLKRRHEIIKKYDEGFKNSKIICPEHFSENATSSGHLYLTRIKDINLEQRNEIMIKMDEKGISTNVHYKPLPMLTAYRNLGFDIEDYPNAYNLFKNEISLPIYSTLSDEEVEYIIENFLDILKEY
ncbi:MAG: DegT/DnrJ/EryC1/StrS family aminotransferase [archaeon]|uniref:dTDP-4-amino-4,6-dideoxygalactose transaminase n=1 Tax=Methanobrevibacter gottschalkii DSM 11977 TaxID=1122229 RepID=A0A3N5B7M4_9EURY|nr:MULTISPECIES: DegT/DnrJ/EryC1/StrS family aminotransferase [Methanobrevibacter]MCQ2970356.1 DegT/DnrJ/EryC1/StrS family aminotransferase [archaeon]OEC95182.1 capsular biosynthesis protein [Methanobrevibacter sp. A27]RPF53089.1 dTDP-4-amino-4,6-dideoxygalactose transaminase [Methanobrevibacter gottschalkii DSM 11977]